MRWFDPAYQNLVVGNANTTLDGSETTLISQDGSLREANVLDMGPFINVKSPTFGAKGNGTTDDTSALLAGIAAASSQNGSAGFLYIPAGTYRFRSQLTIGERVHILGAGKYATQLLFDPTANSTAIKISNGASICDEGSVRDLAVFSNDTSFTKIAFDVVDTNSYSIERIAIQGSSGWHGGNSIGIQNRGRQAMSYRDIDINADRPLVIAQNPNNSISIDHTNFHNFYGIATGNPVIEILTGVNLSNVSFTGYQAWVGGLEALKWVDTTTVQTSNNLRIENVRTEQGTNAALFAINIQHNTSLQGLVLSNCLFGVDRAGIKLRKVLETNFASTFYAGTGVALDVDSTVLGIRGNACFWQAGSTASISGQRLVWGAPLNPNTAPLPPDFFYDQSANADRNVAVNCALSEDPVSVANNGVTGIGPTTTLGLLVVTTSEGASAIYQLKGTFNTTIEASDPVGIFSPTSGTASSVNIYWSAGNSRYELENKRGSTFTFRWTLLGTYS